MRYIKSFKRFLWDNGSTKVYYRTLWHWKHEGFVSAVNYFDRCKRGKAPRSEIKTYHYEMALSMWRYSGLTPKLIDYLSFVSDIPWCWNNERRELWLIYICCLLEMKQEDQARVILNRYYSTHHTYMINRFLPVAHFAFSQGINTEEIERADQIFCVLDTNAKNDLFRKLVSGKSIAIVGNGGSEIGSGRGEEIDAHDIVIRFNNYPKGYENDYGYRTDIWVRNGNVNLTDREDISKFRLVLFEPDIWHMSMQKYNLEDLFRYIQIIPEKIVYIDWRYKGDFLEYSKIQNPTTGAFLLWMAYDALGSFENIDVYGFSFPYEDDDKNSNPGHYYDKLSAMTTEHNMILEKQFLRKFYYENGGKRRIVVPSLKHE